MIIVGLGANLPSIYGSPHQTLLAAIQALEEKSIHVAARAPFYETAPVPISDQPWYVNTVIAVDTDLKPEDLLTLLLSVEQDFGRQRSVQNAARNIDLDLIAYHNETRDTKNLILPHPRMQDRAFVLYPLRDIALDWIHPVTGQKIDSLIAALPSGQEIRKMKEAA